MTVLERAVPRPLALVRTLAWPRMRWWAEILSLALGYVVYSLLRVRAPHHVVDAYRHADHVVGVEQFLHVAWEVPANRWLTSHLDLGLAASYWYSSLHFVLTPALLAFLWLRRRELYAPLRSAIVLATGVALVVYATYPLAPPRFYYSGVVDTVETQRVAWDPGTGSGVRGLVNDLAAMPSLHVCWSLWCAVVLVLALKHRARHLAWLYPLITTAVVVGTANHYLLDAVAAVVVLAVCLRVAGVTRPPSRPRRPSGWSTGWSTEGPLQERLPELAALAD